MANIHEFSVPETKPATEWVNGRALQKVTPRERHARAQSAIAAALRHWAHATGSGRVGSEWEFRVTPPHEATRPLVPDVAFLSYGRIAYDNDEAAQLPYMAPDVAIEILSPGDQPRDVEEKIRVYLASGTSVVFLIDPLEQTVVARDIAGMQLFRGHEVVHHPALPGFSLHTDAIFEKAKPKEG